MAHAQKPDFVFRRIGRVNLNRRGTSAQSTAGSRGVHISGSNAGYTMFWGCVKSTGHPLHSSISALLPLPCVNVCHYISAGLYQAACYATSNCTWTEFSGWRRSLRRCRGYCRRHRWWNHRPFGLICRPHACQEKLTVPQLIKKSPNFKNLDGLFNIIIPSTTRFSTWSFYLRFFPPKPCMHFYCLRYVLHKGRLWVLQHCCLEAYCTLTRMSSFIHHQRRCTHQAAWETSASEGRNYTWNLASNP